MGRSAFVLLLGIACFGCSTLPSRNTTPDDEESGIVDVTEYVVEGDAAAAAQAGPSEAKPPNTEDVAWEDNGIPIRQLTGDGPPQEIKLPGNDMKMQMKKKGVKPIVPSSTPSTLPQN